MEFNSNGKVMVGCGCRNVQDVASFIREKKIEYVELAWADEMGLWHNETVPVRDLTYASLQEGVPCKDGKFLVPDPLSARMAPMIQPNTMIFTCKPPTSRAYLKTKHLNPEWIEMISKRLMENDKRPSVALDPKALAMLNEEQPNELYYGKRTHHLTAPINIPSVPNVVYGNPNSPGCVSSPGSSPGSPGNLSPGSRSPVGSPGNHHGNRGNHANRNPANHGNSVNHGNHGSHGRNDNVLPSPVHSNGFIEWKLIRNDPYGNPPTLALPSSPTSPDTLTGSVPSSPSLPGSPHSPVPDSQDGDQPEQKPVLTKGHTLLPPLLRPRQVHPTKAHKLGIVKPVKKRRNTEHLFCRHCGTTETPEWRRGPDGRKSLCNACGLYYSKMIKRETMVVPQGRRVAIDALLNPHS